MKTGSLYETCCFLPKQVLTLVILCFVASAGITCTTVKKKADNGWILSSIERTKNERKSLLKVQVELERQLGEVALLQEEIESFTLDGVSTPIVGLLRQAAMDCALYPEVISEDGDPPHADSSSLTTSPAVTTSRLAKLKRVFSDLRCQSIALKPLEQTLEKQVSQQSANHSNTAFDDSLIPDFLQRVDQWQIEKNRFHKLLRGIDRKMVDAKRKLEDPYTVLQRLAAKREKEKDDGIFTEGEAERRDELEEEVRQVLARLKILSELHATWKHNIETQTSRIVRKIAVLGINP